MRTILSVIIILWVSVILKAQTHEVFESDSVFIRAPHTKVLGSISFTDKDFEEKLSDGHWLYYKAKDSTVKNHYNYLGMEGFYKDSLKHGKFIYYDISNTKKGKNLTVKRYINYSNGLLDGQFCIFYWNDIKLSEGRYFKGKKDGFFIDYYTKEDKGKIETIRFYKNDTLQNWVRYNRRGYVSSQSYGEENMITGEYILNDSIGRISSKGFFNEGIINKYQIFTINGIIEKEVEGEFYPHEKPKYTQDSYDVIGFTREKLKNGIVREFENGVLKKELNYKDGELVKSQ